MPQTVIRAEGLSKTYCIRHEQTARYQTLRESLAQAARTAGASLFHTPKENHESGTHEEFWALRDVSFEVKQGDRVGIIGRNGAGKSTLLKVLSRITEPSAGRVSIRGRIASLLEVGTGFHPELTGRENIFLNGAVLGMTRAEVKRSFDDIVAFAEIEKFLDTPVKRYSSGMYVRLGFAVAAHLEPEVLIVDEVLAVGDAQFQRKCLGKMEEVSRGGRTVLFVSHNMTAVRKLCSWALLLDDGSVKAAGETEVITQEYLRERFEGETGMDLSARIRALPEDPAFRLLSLSLRQAGHLCAAIRNGEALEIAVSYRVLQRARGFRICLDLLDDEGGLLVRTFQDDDWDDSAVVEAGEYRSTAVLPADFLAPRAYTLRIFGTLYNVRNMGEISVPLNVEATSGINRAYPAEPIRSKLQPRIPWTTEFTASVGAGIITEKPC